VASGARLRPAQRRGWPTFNPQAAPTEAELAALLAARRAYNRHYTAIQTMLQTNDDSEHDLSYVKIVNFETALAPRLVDRPPPRFDAPAPAARPVPPRAQAAAPRPEAPAAQLGSLRWPRRPASGRPKEEEAPSSTTRRTGCAASCGSGCCRSSRRAGGGSHSGPAQWEPPDRPPHVHAPCRRAGGQPEATHRLPLPPRLLRV